jgi:carboxypeptidase PM20D1
MSPVLLSGHYDIVPVISGTEPTWTNPPFAGVMDDTHIWGRAPWMIKVPLLEC